MRGLLSLVATFGSNGEIVIQLRDQGPGFLPGIVEQLFEPFFSTKAEGTGMGLAIARSIVETHGGTLSGKNCASGACFTVRLPAAKDDTTTTPSLIAGGATEPNGTTEGAQSVLKF